MAGPSVARVAGLMEDEELCERLDEGEDSMQTPGRGGLGRVAAKVALLAVVLCAAVLALLHSSKWDHNVARPVGADVRAPVALYDELRDELVAKLAGTVGVPIPPASTSSSGTTDPAQNQDDTELELSCRDGEELFMGLCYKKCSVLTQNEMPIRSAPTACCKQQPCFLPSNVRLSGFMPCTGFEIDGNGKCPRPPGECDANEESYLGTCYKQCTLLTNNEYPKRVGPNTCCTGTSCWNIFHLKTEGAACSGYAVGGGAEGHECPHKPE